MFAKLPTVKTVVIIPTFNEHENIAKLIPELLQTQITDICVVDDSSPDGTAKVVEKFQSEGYKNVHLILRSQKQGLAKAYLAGFSWALEKGYSAIFQMDADFSHRVTDLIRLHQAIQTKDFVIGSRYVPGGEILNWEFQRRWISQAGNLYARLILGGNINDWTGGFNGWKSYVLKKLLSGHIVSEGYTFQIELKYRALKSGFNFEEVPIKFEDRRVGQSKMSKRIIFEAFWRVLWLKLNL